MVPTVDRSSIKAPAKIRQHGFGRTFGVFSIACRRGASIVAHDVASH
jgi:hypothetical protein